MKIAHETDLNFILNNMQHGDKLEILSISDHEVLAGVAFNTGGGITSRGQRNLPDALMTLGDLLAVHRKGPE